MTRDRRILNALLLEAKKAYNMEQEDDVYMYAPVPLQLHWRCVAICPKRPSSTVVLDSGITDRIIGDARDFLASRAWYARRGIPFRRGYLLYGAPGSGKTSLIHSFASELNLDVYIISLSQSGMDDGRLAELIAGLPEQCIALMEDIDAAFHHGLNRDSITSTSATGPSRKPIDSSQALNPNNNATEQHSGSQITLSGLLNALDGVGAQEGRILFATTNKYSALDPALCRPGRMDLHVEFKLASKYQMEELFKRFYRPDDEAEVDVRKKEEETPGEKSLDSGYGSVSRDEDADGVAADTSTSQLSLIPPAGGVQAILHTQTHSALSKAQVLALASRFALVVPEREFSMAALQGYLMMYKTSAIEAVESVGQWVEKEMADRAEKAHASNSKFRAVDNMSAIQ
jgi:mitochondrial chaperone BCS1